MKLRTKKYAEQIHVLYVDHCSALADGSGFLKVDGSELLSAIRREFLISMTEAISWSLAGTFCMHDVIHLLGFFKLYYYFYSRI